MAADFKAADGTLTLKSNINFIANKTLLVQIFQNLISNALKYRDRKRPSEIVVDCTEQENYWLFSVLDNGIGIEEKYSKKVFSVLQRLHRWNDIEGHGIGLNICKKAVEQYGGLIWLEPEPGKGSCFFFTIQKPTGE